MSPHRILLVDDSASERREVSEDIRLFFDSDAEIVEAGEVGMAIIAFRRCMGLEEGSGDAIGLHAAILDYQLEDRLTSKPLYRQMLALAPEFARTRVALRTSLSEQDARAMFAEDQLEFPSKYLSKGHLIELINWLKGLPEGEGRFPLN